MSDVLRQFGPPPAPALFTPESEVLRRVQAEGASEGDKAEALRVARGVAVTFEEACGMPLLRREGVTLDIEEVGYNAQRRCHLVELDSAAPGMPVEAVTAVHIDADAEDGLDIEFGAEDLIDPSLYRQIYLEGWCLLIKQEVEVPDLPGAVRVTLTCGYEQRSDADGWTPTEGAYPMPADLEEAFLEQSALLFKRRLSPHLRYEGRPVGAGSANAGYATTDLTANVRATLRRYATWQHALNLDAGGGGGGGGAAGGAQ